MSESRKGPIILECRCLWSCTEAPGEGRWGLQPGWSHPPTLASVTVRWPQPWTQGVMSLATCQSSKFHFKLVFFQILWNFCTSQKVPSFQCDLRSDRWCSALEMKISFLGFTLSGLPKGAALWGLGHLGWTRKATVVRGILLWVDYQGGCQALLS